MFRIMRVFLPSLLAAGTVLWGAETDCNTPDGSTVPDGQVSAQASFVSGPGFITVTLTNLLANPVSAGQLLSGLAFTVSEGETTGTLGANSANIRSISTSGAFTDLGPGGTGWALAQNFNAGFELCVLCTNLGGLGPSHLLIGPPATSGFYTFANRSIVNNGPHNPFTTGTATFLVNLPGVTVNSTVTNATFFFSTTEGVGVGANCSGGGIPE